jgi:predicted DNA-binding protein
VEDIFMDDYIEVPKSDDRRVQVAFRLPRSLIERIDEIGAKTVRTRSNVVEYILVKYLDYVGEAALKNPFDESE